VRLHPRCPPWIGLLDQLGADFIDQSVSGPDDMAERYQPTDV
jgi:hypothetical protein